MSDRVITITQPMKQLRKWRRDLQKLYNHIIMIKAFQIFYPEAAQIISRNNEIMQKVRVGVNA